MLASCRGAFIRIGLVSGIINLLMLTGSIFMMQVYERVLGSQSVPVASGIVVVESNLRKVQRPTGGVVGALNVREGQRVKAGDIVVRLDDTTTRANLGIVLNELTALRARLVRLHAERDGSGEPIFPDDLQARAGNEPEVRLPTFETGFLPASPGTARDATTLLRWVTEIVPARLPVTSEVTQATAPVPVRVVLADSNRGTRGSRPSRPTRLRRSIPRSSSLPTTPSTGSPPSAGVSARRSTRTTPCSRSPSPARSRTRLGSCSRPRWPL